MPSLAPDDYTAAAARVMLEKTHTPPQQLTDLNAYELGELNGHNIVIAYLPSGVYGTVSAAGVFGLMVGIGGGVPSKNNDIRLGDVVVSKPGGKHVHGGQFEQTGIKLQAQQITGGMEAIQTIVSEVLERNPDLNEKFSPPEQQTDCLFNSSYHHADKESDCQTCDQEQLVKRQPRGSMTPYVMKDSETRDCLAQEHGVLCFEMEAAGLMNGLPTLVQKQWQGYAALTAAAYTKLLLLAMPNHRTNFSSPKEDKARHWMVSLPRNPKFVGRHDEIMRLEELLTMRDGPRRIAITGLGGVGKTQVALEVAYRIRDRDKECSVLWVPCTSHAMIEQIFLEFAEMVKLHDVKPAEIKEQIKTYLSSKRAGKWLLVFDNADDTDMWLAAKGTASALVDCLPQSEQGRILFTTRNRKLAMKLAPFYIIPIPDVDKETAFGILKKALEHEDLPNYNKSAATLLEHLAFLPLAITQASAYIVENSISLSDYVTLFQEQEENAVELLSEDFRDPQRYKEIQNPVITTWLISFTQIQHQNKVAADYLCFMACINPRNIPRSILPSQITKKQIFDALGLLNAYSFTNSRDSVISIHRLVYIATRNWLRNNGLFVYWVQRAAEHMQAVFPDSHYTNRELWREYLPHALVLAYENNLIEQQEQHVDFLQNIADCLASDGRYHESEGLYRRLLKINQERHGDKHPNTLSSMANLASTYRNQGRLNEAEELEVQVLETSKTVLGDQHPNTLSSMASLASTYRYRGQWNDAEKLEAHVMETSKTGRWNEAKELDVQVMETSKTVLGDKHPITLSSMANLAATYRYQGQWNEAEELEAQVMETRKTVLGDKHPNTLSSMANLAYTWKSQGKLPDALALLEECCRLRHKHLQGVSMQQTSASILTQRHCVGHIGLFQTQGSVALGFLADAHPFTISARAASPAARGQATQEVD
ncbi:hypothetical protein BJX63DRAFT_418491 [Aspergillus granulosus]|uniref:NB-ARC domain-containing protein n=1 Tax=Aspergillus granulosus TaxID=176169 RepID=A0ABR4HY53_9EURO